MYQSEVMPLRKEACACGMTTVTCFSPSVLIFSYQLGGPTQHLPHYVPVWDLVGRFHQIEYLATSPLRSCLLTLVRLVGSSCLTWPPGSRLLLENSGFGFQCACQFSAPLLGNGNHHETLLAINNSLTTGSSIFRCWLS